MRQKKWRDASNASNNAIDNTTSTITSTTGAITKPSDAYIDR